MSKVKPEDMHNVKVDFGKHEGELYTRLPVGYLTWMVNANHSRKEYAQAELDRRGTTMPEIQISGHAIDRFSLRYMDKFWERRNENEGLHSFMHRMALEAHEKGKQDGDRYFYYGIKFVFAEGSEFPTLKTVL